MTKFYLVTFRPSKARAIASANLWAVLMSFTARLDSSQQSRAEGRLAVGLRQASVTGTDSVSNKAFVTPVVFKGPFSRQLTVSHTSSLTVAGSAGLGGHWHAHGQGTERPVWQAESGSQPEATTLSLAAMRLEVLLNFPAFLTGTLILYWSVPLGMLLGKIKPWKIYGKRDDAYGWYALDGAFVRDISC